jgi:hypothetical protein
MNKPKINNTACTTNALPLDMEPEEIEFSQMEIRVTTPYIWLSNPARPIIHIRNAGICKILIALIKTSRSVIDTEIHNCFPAEAHRDFPISIAAGRKQLCESCKTEEVLK